MWPCDHPGAERCSQSVAIPLILLMLSFSVSVGPGGCFYSTSPPGFWDFHNGDLSEDSWFSCEGDDVGDNLHCHLDP